MVGVSPKMALGGMIIATLLVTGGTSAMIFGLGGSSDSGPTISVEWNDEEGAVTATITEVESVESIELQHQSKDFQDESDNVRLSGEDVQADGSVTITSDDIDGDIENGDKIYLFVTDITGNETIEEIHTVEFEEESE